jgi:hypothetical protein
MVALSALWLPILLAAVFVFIASSIIHMMPLWHRGDYPRLDAEDQIIAALRPLGLRAGDFMIPRARDMNEMKTPEFKEKVRQGPVIVGSIFPAGGISMGRNLGLWFFYTLIVSLFAGYIASRAVAPGSEYLEVFRFAGTTAFMAYGLGIWSMFIWFGRSMRMTVIETFDGLIYALVTAGVFGWLWPS